VNYADANYDNGGSTMDETINYLDNINIQCYSLGINKTVTYLYDPGKRYTTIKEPKPDSTWYYAYSRWNGAQNISYYRKEKPNWQARVNEFMRLKAYLEGKYGSSFWTGANLYFTVSDWNFTSPTLSFYAACPYCGIKNNSFSYSCGQTQDETLICPAYTIAPTVRLNNMTSSTILTETNTSFYPQIKVFDNENDNLTCNYYLDGSTTATGTMPVTGSKPEKVVTFTTPFSTASLAEGSHTIKVTASDNFAKYIGEATLTFKVDKSYPTINTIGVEKSINSIKLTVDATDAVSGLAANAYRYTIGGTPTGWLTERSFPRDRLLPNTTYAYTVEVKDAVGHISTKTGNSYTMVETPVTIATALAGSGIQLVVKDSNPVSTLYRVQVGSKYATSTGALSTTSSWFTLTDDATAGGKKLTLSGLAANTSYTIIVTSKNSTDGMIAVGTSVSAMTAPGVPTNLTASNVTSSNIYLNWGSVSGASSYELYRSTVTSNGTVTDTKTIPSILTNYYNDTYVSADQRYLYIIRCKNQNGIYGTWSSPPLSVKTIPLPPVQVTGITAVVNGSVLDISWNVITGVIGYEVEVTCDGDILSDRYTTTNQISFDTEKYNCHSTIRVKAYNLYTGNDASDHTRWTNEGEWSNVSIPYYTEANVPTIDSIDAGQVTNNTADITWSINSNPDSVQYKLGIFHAGILKKETAITGDFAASGKLTYQITALLPETTYSFKLKAVNSNFIESDWSNEVSIMTLIDEPDVITGLRATAKSDRITLFWNPAERAQSYEIDRNGDIIASDITSTSYVDTDVTSDTEYTYKVIAVNTTGNSSSSLVKKTLGNLPSSPTITSVTGSSISCTIEWTTVEPTTGYDIEVDGKVYNVGMNTIYESNGLVPGSYHIYRVRARNIYGKSSWSEATTFYPMPFAPDTPISVSSSSSDTQIQIIWDGVVGAESYDVEIDGIMYSGILASEYWYTATEGEILGTVHTIRIRAVNEGGISGWSAALTTTLSVEGSIPTITVPSTPEIVSSVSGSAITTISWSDVEYATQYQLEADGSILYTGTGTSYVHAGLPEGSQHVYAVRAGNSSGFSEWSNSVLVTVGSFSGVAPENINYYRVSDNVTAIIWDKVSNVSSYQIEINGIIMDELFYNSSAEISTIPGVQYTIRIATRIQNGEDTLLEWSDEMVFCTPSALPISVEIVDISASSDIVTLTWTEVPDAYGYEIEFDGQVIKIENTLSYSITSLEASTSYTIRVRAYNDAGAGNWCEAVTIMTHAGILGVPINITGEPVAAISAATGSSIRIHWDVLVGASSYEVEDPNGQIYTTDTNEIIINNLIAGLKYDFRIRALTNAEAGAWSSKISFIPKVTTPGNLSISSEDGVIRLSWEIVGGAELYEIEIDGVTIATTSNSSIDLDYSLFYVQRSIRIRASMGTQKSEWSQEIRFEQTIPINLEVYENETISILLPVENAEIGKYKLTLQYDPEEMILLDACEITPEKELSTTYIDELNMHIIIEQIGDYVSISFIVDGDENVAWSGIVSSIKFRCNITGTVTLKYGVRIR
jgi:fibronectin type 3 domain-containing protein